MTDRWRWLATAGVVLVVGVPVAFGGLEATGDLCDSPYDDRFENVVETVVVHCFDEARDGSERDATRVNWIGVTAGLSFLIGTFFAAAALFRALPRKRGAAIAAACWAATLALTLVWFA